ncbi:MAG: ImmA/IrrE family metallo-endopeptidase [Planctomycetes bacterium]|nr:ImmA/IrrE family metallo-endopeptidase [Planctomycetota bacterium]
MRRGSVVEQVYESVGKDGAKVRRGPYLLYSFKEKGKTVSRRIKDPTLKTRYEEQIGAFRRFQELTAQLLRIGEQIAEWALSGEEERKKTPSRRRSNVTIVRVDVKPELLRWARERAGLSVDALVRRFPRLEAWEDGQGKPTLKQVEKFAKATYAPVGFLFLAEPPRERVPIPDFRTRANLHAGHPSPNLLDTIYVCQQRQEWYRDFARSQGEEPLQFVGSAQVGSDVEATAASIRHHLGFDVEERRQMPTRTNALRRFIGQAEDLGILVMCNGVVLNNNRRRLDPEEFRGFAMVDDLAPLVFINGADTKAGQMFTLAHELAHIWIGQSAVSDAQPLTAQGHRTERWCNRVAAELLVPVEAMRREYSKTADLGGEVQRLARYFKVSSLVILRRIHDVGGLTRQELWEAYAEELARLRAVPKGSGGNFYLTQAARVSKRFARALVANTLEGQTLYRDAFRMLGFSKHATFRDLGRSLGVWG